MDNRDRRWIRQTIQEAIQEVMEIHQNQFHWEEMALIAEEEEVPVQEDSSTKDEVTD